MFRVEIGWGSLIRLRNYFHWVHMGCLIPKIFLTLFFFPVKSRYNHIYLLVWLWGLHERVYVCVNACEWAPMHGKSVPPTGASHPSQSPQNVTFHPSLYWNGFFNGNKKEMVLCGKPHMTEWIETPVPDGHWALVFVVDTLRWAASFWGASQRNKFLILSVTRCLEVLAAGNAQRQRTACVRNRTTSK